MQHSVAVAIAPSRVERVPSLVQTRPLPSSSRCSTFPRASLLLITSQCADMQGCIKFNIDEICTTSPSSPHNKLLLRILRRKLTTLVGYTSVCQPAGHLLDPTAWLHGDSIQCSSHSIQQQGKNVHVFYLYTPLGLAEYDILCFVKK